jgi:hypothetical protein
MTAATPAKHVIDGTRFPLGNTAAIAEQPCITCN